MDRKTQDQLKTCAHKLVELSLDETGRVSAERVGGVLTTLEQNPPRHLRALLKQYLVYIRQELARSQAQVEYAGELPASTLAEIRQELSEHYNRAVDVLPRENESLIAGFRVAIGDDVYDASLAGRLHALETAID
ncbi:MAG: F0F1 ATP synthase subunit delta [Puniceicoccales bacterium]